MTIRHLRVWKTYSLVQRFMKKLIYLAGLNYIETEHRLRTKHIFDLRLRKNLLPKILQTPSYLDCRYFWQENLSPLISEKHFDSLPLFFLKWIFRRQFFKPGSLMPWCSQYADSKKCIALFHCMQLKNAIFRWEVLGTEETVSFHQRKFSPLCTETSEWRITI